MTQKVSEATFTRCNVSPQRAQVKYYGHTQHEAVSKETGETAHIERFHTTIRQRLGRFVRKTRSFSKSDTMHEICLRLFLFRYNRTLPG